MLTYKQYKQLNESLYGYTNLGVVTPNVIAAIGGTGASDAVEEGKKGFNFDAKKDDGDDDGDDDGSKKKKGFNFDSKKKDDDGDDDSSKKKTFNFGKKKDDDGDDDKDKDSKKKTFNFGKKKEDDSDDKDGKDEKACCGDEMAFMKKGAKKGMKAEQTEDEKNWWSSVNDMVGIDPNTKNWDGMSIQQEDALLEPTNDGLVYKEPQAGEPGFAPQQRLGSNFSAADPGWKYSS